MRNRKKSASDQAHTFAPRQKVRIIESPHINHGDTLWKLSRKVLVVTNVMDVPQDEQVERGHHQMVKVRVEGSAHRTNWYTGYWFEPIGSK